MIEARKQAATTPAAMASGPMYLSKSSLLLLLSSLLLALALAVVVVFWEVLVTASFPAFGDRSWHDREESSMSRTLPVAAGP